MGLQNVVCLLAGLAVLGVCTAEKIVFYESFAEDFTIDDRWVVSKTADYGGEWKYAAAEGTGDFGLLVSQKAQKYGIAASLPEPVDPKKDTVVLQYDLRLQNGIECGGAYLKFLMPQETGWTPSQFKDDSPYSIMFGPDKCGATNKVHFIFRHKNPKTGKYVEHHLKSPAQPVNDKFSHVYSAIIYPNNTLKILIDGEVKKTADLLSLDFDPPVLPQETIPDPEDKKPEDWDERAKIADPEATKPEEWDENAPKMIEDVDAKIPDGWLEDEPAEVDDPEASKPDDWDEEEDGEWEPSKVPNPKCEEGPGCGEWKKPLIKNPAYKGKWSPQMIDNPAYKGLWKPRDIPNPEYFHLEHPDLEPVAAVGIEIWTMNDGIIFDNILVTHDEAAAEKYRETTWKPKYDKEKEIEKVKQDKEDAVVKKNSKEKSEKTTLALLFDNFYKIAELPFFKPVKKYIVDFLRFVESKDEYAYAFLASLFVLTVAIIYALLPSKRRKPRKVSLEQAKKEDISTPDDVVENASEGEGKEKDDGEDNGEGEKAAEEAEEVKPVESEPEAREEIQTESVPVKRRVRRET